MMMMMMMMMIYWVGINENGNLALPGISPGLGCLLCQVVTPSGHTMFIQCLNVDATSWRCIEVEATLYRRHVLAGRLFHSLTVLG